MTAQIDLGDSRFPELAEAILRRHERGDAEANITSAVRDFLIATQLASADEIIEEVHPGDTGRQAVDLTALDTYVEFKRRTGYPQPQAEWVEQIDGYLEASQEAGKGARLGVLTDGRHWFLRWPGAGPVRTDPPHAFVLDDAARWFGLYEWLRDHALGASEHIRPSHETVAERFAVGSIRYERDLDALRRLYLEHGEIETVRVKRRLWLDLLRAATGESADAVDDLDDLFVRHTYLTAVTGMAVQARFGIDVIQLAEADATDLLVGRRFRDQTGLHGVVETDFFSWPAEVGGEPLLRTIARRVARFDWDEAPADIAAILYETVIPADERRHLGEYYTPDWLARQMLEEVVTSPLEQRVLDPACGSGTFIAEAVARFVTAAEDATIAPISALQQLREAVIGIDIHPVAVHLARSTWAIAAQPLIESAVAAGFHGGVSAPVYLGDSLQLRFGAGDLLAEAEVRIAVGDDENSELVFPTSLVERADVFDDVMGAVAAAITRGADPVLELADHPLSEGERQSLAPAVRTMSRLHASGRNHIWAYYTRNLVRPVALARRKADVIIGNPPWLNYNQTIDMLRVELERQSKEVYGIWVGGRYATHQDVAGLFFARCVDLYLDNGGVIGMVLPRSALAAGQYSRWRSGHWAARSGIAHQMDLGFKRPWDLARLSPNDFFPIPACVAFGRRAHGDVAVPLAGQVERWEGTAGGASVDRIVAPLDPESEERSPYRDLATQGATLVPRCLFLVEEIANPAIIQAGGTFMTTPRRGKHDKSPWRDLDLTDIERITIEDVHVFRAVLGESVAPYVMLEPLLAVLPVRRDDGDTLPTGDGESSLGGVDLQLLARRMRDRWRTISTLWDEHKQPVNRLSLLERLDYHRELSRQLTWRANAHEGACRIVYSKSGRPTAARLTDRDAIVDHTLYWMPCASDDEAAYLLAIINSNVLRDAVEPHMSRGLWGARDLHKHLWNLQIPRFDPGDPSHVEIAAVGEIASTGARKQIPDRDGPTGAAARRLVRQWLASSDEGREVERAVGGLFREVD